MFDNTFNVGDIPMETASGYGNTNAFMIGAMQGAQGMVSGLGRLAGFQTEEDLLKEIYDNADFSTPEGRQAAVDAVMKINPEEGNKLQKQLSDAATAEARQRALAFAPVMSGTGQALRGEISNLLNNIYQNFQMQTPTGAGSFLDWAMSGANNQPGLWERFGLNPAGTTSGGVTSNTAGSTGSASIG